MTHISRTVGVVATAILVCTAMGCVEQEASLGLRGVVQFSGSQTSTEVECTVPGTGGPNSEPETVKKSKPELTCDRQVEPGSVSNFRTSISIDINEFRTMNGQLTGISQRLVSDEQFCSWDPVTFEQVKYRHPWIEIAIDSVNRLQDSREVGAKGQGSGGGGFDGLKLDVNDIQIQDFRIRFPNVPETGEGQLNLDKNVKLAMLAESGGGGATIATRMFESGDIDALEQLHKTLVTRRAGLSNYGDKAQRTSVTLIAEMWLEGETLGEREVESNRIEFPIKLCGKGCGLSPDCFFAQESGG